MDGSTDHPRPKFKHLHRIEGFNHARALNWSCFRNQPFLRDDRAKSWVLDAIVRAKEKHPFDVWAWCLMPTHVHLLIFPCPFEKPPVANILRSIKLPVSQAAIAWAKRFAPDQIDLMLDRQPSGVASHRFWQRGGGYDRNLDSDRTLWKMIDYIHANPVVEGLCRHPSDWPWSSAITYEDRSCGKLALQLQRLPARPL